MNGKSDLASYLKKKWENVLGDPNAQRYVSKGNEIPPRSANLQDSSSNQAPNNQNNVNSPKNTSKNSVYSDYNTKNENVKKDTPISVKNTSSIIKPPMLSSEPPKGGGDMQTDSSSVSALPPNTDINSGSDPKVVFNLSSSSKSDLTSVLRPPAMASSHSTLEIAPKSLEQASLTPFTECKRSLDGVTPTLGEHGLVDDCLSTISADAAKATND